LNNAPHWAFFSAPWSTYAGARSASVRPISSSRQRSPVGQGFQYGHRLQSGPGGDQPDQDLRWRGCAGSSASRRRTRRPHRPLRDRRVDQGVHPSTTAGPLSASPVAASTAASTAGGGRASRAEHRAGRHHSCRRGSRPRRFPAAAGSIFGANGRRRRWPSRRSTLMCGSAPTHVHPEDARGHERVAGRRRIRQGHPRPRLQRDLLGGDFVDVFLRGGARHLEHGAGERRRVPAGAGTSSVRRGAASGSWRSTG
jgi:hypothetical protein